MERTRSSFLFFGQPGFYPLDVGSLNYRYAGIPENSIGVLDTGVPRYIGTVFLRVSPIACGTFTMGFNTGFPTFIGDNSPEQLFVFPGEVPLRLTIPINDCVRQLLSCSPVHCNVDARIHHDRHNTAVRLNTNIIDMTFSKSTVGMAAADFEVSLRPHNEGDVIPTILSVTPDAGNANKARVVFLPRIRQSQWTCFRDRGSNKRCCMGSLPGDVNGDRFSRASDTFEIFENLVGLISPALAIEKCDTDRSLLCTPADVLMVVDLMNGADAFVPVTNQSLPTITDPFNGKYECPAMVLPPP